MRLEDEEQERLWDRKQKQNEVEINELKEKAKFASTEMEKLRKDNERLMGLREEERLQWEGKWSQKEIKTPETRETCRTRHEVTELAETREMGTIEERLHGKDGVKEAAHTHRGSGGQWG